MNAQPMDRTQPREIQICGLTCFPMNQWRNAVCSYLFGMWAGHGSVTYRPKICFDSVTLRLDQDLDQYLAYGRGHSPLPNWSSYTDGQIQEVCSGQYEVESGLIRFVKDNRVRVLVIDFENSQLILYKGKKRGMLNVATRDIPRVFRGLAPIPDYFGRT